MVSALNKLQLFSNFETVDLFKTQARHEIILFVNRRVGVTSEQSKFFIKNYVRIQLYIHTNVLECRFKPIPEIPYLG